MSELVLVNFSHPITEAQRAQIATAAGLDDLSLIDVPTHFDTEAAYGPQAEALMAAAGLTPTEWQTLPIIVNLPSFNVIAALVLARLHGLMGHFPAIVRMRPVEGAIPPRFAFAELIDLNAHRVRAASQRG
jgi:hypothetical protein